MYLVVMKLLEIIKKFLRTTHFKTKELFKIYLYFCHWLWRRYGSWLFTNRGGVKFQITGFKELQPRRTELIII